MEKGKLGSKAESHHHGAEPSTGIRSGAVSSPQRSRIGSSALPDKMLDLILFEIIMGVVFSYFKPL